MEDAPRLHVRLRNCLQTILDLEPELQTMRVASPMLTELSMLKDLHAKLETLFVQEDDVQRIEKATAQFLTELKGIVRRESSARFEQRFLQ